jgi:hypothetical protein
VRSLSTGCDHLENTYDRYFLKRIGKMPDDASDEQVADLEQELIEYALNRMLALDRDNGNKAQGVPASRVYESRNTKGSRALANLCGALGPRGLRCIRTRHPNEPDKHKF